MHGDKDVILMHRTFHNKESHLSSYPLQKGSDVPLDLTAVRFLASLMSTCNSPLDFPPPFAFLLLALSDVTNLSKIMRSPLYVIKAMELEFCKRRKK